MKVKQLIKKLQELNPDSEIEIMDNDWSSSCHYFKIVDFMGDKDSSEAESGILIHPKSKKTIIVDLDNL